MATIRVTAGPWNESGTPIILSSADGIYMSTDSGVTVVPANTSITLNDQLALYVKAGSTYAAFYVIRSEGASAIGSYISLLNGVATIGAVNVSTLQDVKVCLVDGIPADSVKPVSVVFDQPEEGQTKVNQVRVSVDGGTASTTSPVEIPAGSAAQVEYSYQPFDAYIGPTILQNVAMSPDTQEVLITPIVDNLGYKYYSDGTYTPMTKDQQYTIPTHKGDDNTDYLAIGAVVDGKFSNVCYCALIGDKWALYCPGCLSNSGQIVTRVISTRPTSTSFILGKIENNISISVNHDNTTTPEVQ